MYYQNTMDFSEWIVSELAKKGWSRSEAARRGNISPSMFDKVINGYSKPGMKFIEGIAQAFGIPVVEVMLHISSKNVEDPWVEEMSQKLPMIPPALRDVAKKFIDSVAQATSSRVSRNHERTINRHIKGQGSSVHS